MPPAAEPRPRNVPKLVATLVWFLIAGWLVVGILVGLVRAIFFGSGPIIEPPQPERGALVAPLEQRPDR